MFLYKNSFFFNIYSFNPNHAYWNQRRLFSGNLPGMFEIFTGFLKIVFSIFLCSILGLNFCLLNDNSGPAMFLTSSQKKLFRFTLVHTSLNILREIFSTSLGCFDVSHSVVGKSKKNSG